MPTIDRRPVKGQPTEEKEAVVDTTEETETPADSSTAETPDETVEGTGDETPSTNLPEPQVEEENVEEKRVQGLKAEEERLRKQIEELRKERRNVRQETPAEKPLLIPAETSSDLADVAPSDVQLIEKVLRAKGYVRKDEIQSMTYAEKLDAAKETWLQAHPEYLPANDLEDVKWAALNSAIKSYFKAPPKPEDVARVMDMAHQMIGGTPKQTLPKKNVAANAASQEKVKSLSKGTGGSAGNKTPAPKRNIDTSHLIGFTEEELEEMKSG